MDFDFVPRTIVHGALLSRSVGKMVSIIAKPNDIDSSGKLFKAITTDGHNIRVILSDPLNSPIEDWIELIGIVTSGDSLKCSEIITFDKNENDSKEFNTKSHNMMVNFLTNCSDFGNCGP